MDLGAADLSASAYGLGAIAHAAFAVIVWRARRRGRVSGPPALWLLAATGCTAAWALAVLVDGFSAFRATAYLASALDVLRYAAWYAFLLMLLDPTLAGGWRAAARNRLAAFVCVVALLALAGVALRMAAGAHRLDAWMPGVTIAMLLGILGALLCEQVFRNLDEDSRWSAKPVCLALVVVFAFDVFMNAEALLFGRIDPDAAAIRPVVHTLAIPLLAVAIRRRGDWLRRIQVSRSAAFHSATLMLAGGYLLFMASIGYYVRYFGGQWGRGLQLGLLFAGALALLVLMVSGSLRARLRVFVGKHFFSYRFDYREEWLRFTAMLSGRNTPQEVANLVIRGLAGMVESPGGDVWTATADGDFEQTSRWNVASVADREPPQGSFANFLRDEGWVVDLDEYRASPRRYGQLMLPLWLLGSTNTWLVVPLLVDERLLGFVTLARPRAPMELNWEVRDLLKTASRQAAGFLAQMQATEALLEARKFDAFNRMSAFVVHDLKNIVTQLSLMLKNAERLHANREFQQDMLLTVESSLEKMRRLLLQLREGTPPAGGVHGVELEPIIQRIAQTVAAQGREMSVEIRDKLSTRGHDERLERVLGHLVQNALDATPAAGGNVWVKLARRSGQVAVEIGDTGAGMSEEFVRTRLFRPFSSTKHSGMGIGSFESAQYVRELGGSIDVTSDVGRGTLMTVILPLFESGVAHDAPPRTVA